MDARSALGPLGCVPSGDSSSIDRRIISRWAFVLAMAFWIFSGGTEQGLPTDCVLNLRYQLSTPVVFRLDSDRAKCYA